MIHQVKNFAKSIDVLHDIIEKFQPRLYKDLFLNGAFTVLKSRDHLGRQVIVSRIGTALLLLQLDNFCFYLNRKTILFCINFFVAKWDPKGFDFDEAACAAMLLFSFTVGQSVETQRQGIVFVHDLTGFGMQHVKAIKPGRLTQLVGLMQVQITTDPYLKALFVTFKIILCLKLISLSDGMQDGSPGRIKGIHMVFHPKIFGMIYQLVKPFLKEKLSSRVRISY